VRDTEQLKARMRVLAKEAGLEVEVVLREYMMERLLGRLAASEHCDRFALKGGMLVVALVGIRARVTMDMDVSFSGELLTVTTLSRIFTDIAAMSVADGVTFSVVGVSEIRGGGEYPGFRVTLAAMCGNLRQTLHVDAAAGDAITPRPEGIELKSLFDLPPIRIRAYNVETVLAEKIETVFSRGVANSRMRDFYDLLVLSREVAFNATLFRQAVLNTARRRGTEEQLVDGRRIFEEVASNATMAGYWRRYASKNKFASELPWDAVLDAVRGLVRIACGDSAQERALEC